MTATTADLEEALKTSVPPRAKAQAVTAALRRGATPTEIDAVIHALPALRPLAPRAGQAAMPFLNLIATAAASGQTELASALGLVLRGCVTPRDPQGPAGRYLTGARIGDLTSRAVLWRAGAAIPRGPLHEACRQRYARLYPYWRSPDAAPAGTRVLVLNRLPNLLERNARFVHNQSNLPNGYEDAGRTPGFDFDVFFLVGTDFEAVADQIEPPTVVYNNVLSAETLDAEGHAETIHRIAAHFGVPLINAPEQCLPYTRVGNYERIGEQAHYVFPRTQRFDAGLDPTETAKQIEAAFDWPVILRDPFSHMGTQAHLAQDRAEAVTALTKLQAKGAYAIQYHDLPQTDGLYYRYRIFKMGETVFSSRIHVAEGWNVHGKEHDALKEGRPELELGALEVQFWEEPTSLVPEATWSALSDLVRSTGADVMGCDFTLMPDGRALIFELNGSMHVTLKGRDAFERLCGFQRPDSD